jgi:hypothetical protein
MPKDLLLSPYRPCFQHLDNLHALPLWELIALSCNLDPRELEKHAKPGDRNYPSYVGTIWLYQDFAPKRQLVLSIASTNDIPFTNPNDNTPIDERYVNCEEFHQWAITHNVDLPEEFPWRPAQPASQYAAEPTSLRSGPLIQTNKIKTRATPLDDAIYAALRSAINPKETASVYEALKIIAQVPLGAPGYIAPLNGVDEEGVKYLDARTSTGINHVNRKRLNTRLKSSKFTNLHKAS